MKKIFITDIEKLLNNERFSINIKNALEILSKAINDWPNVIDNINDYELDVQNFIMNTTTKKNIEKTLSNIDFSKYAWQAESLSELLAIYNYFNKAISLKDIINQIQLVYYNQLQD